MTFFISTQKNIPLKKIIGGKAYNLFQLKKRGFRVPKFIVFPSNFIEDILYNELKIDRKKASAIFSAKHYSKQGTNINKINKLIIQEAISRKIYNQVNEALKEFNETEVIVRSSSIEEDGPIFSFAGIFESKVSHNYAEEVIKAIRHLIKGLFSYKIVSYLRNQKIKKFPTMSIIIQEFVRGDISGVMFSSIRKKGHTGLLINCNKGLAESVVQGKQSESYFFPINARSIISGNSLNKSQQDSLRQKGKEIEKIFKHPQDIEWTIKNNKIFFLQTRPVTSQISQNVIVWDNSNIAESYSGIVLPLTCSFARDIYKVVYTDLAKHSGINDSKLREYEPIFENLLGFFYGRFYYNILNWYRMLTMYPGYKRNKINLDRMISVRSKTELDMEYNRNVSLLFTLYYYLLVTFKYLNFDSKIHEFKISVKLYYLKVRKLDYSRKNAKELIDLYYDFQKKLLSKWYLTLENDYAVMSFYGALTNFCKKNNIQKKFHRSYF